MTDSPLASLTLARVSKKLTEFGSSLEGDNKHAITALLAALDQGLNGTLAHGYHLSAIDPGVGKSLSVSSFLQVWKEQGFEPSGSVLIGLSRLEEIQTYLDNSCLTNADIAVLTSDKTFNGLGVPRADHGNARVMFTTQQMIESRTRGRSFAEAAEFHYQGQPRTLRIWDESFLPAEGLSIRADNLACLPSALRHKHPEYAQAAQEFVTELWASNGSTDITIRKDLAKPPQAVKTTAGKEFRETLESLERLNSPSTSVTRSSNGDVRLIGASTPIPADFAPVIILDASGRVRSTYGLWESNDAPLRRLPAAVKDYKNLQVHVWERAAGKEALTNPAARDEIAQAVAEAIREHPSGNWLIISYKDQPLEKEVIKALKENMPTGGLHFLTWGMHHGTNAYKDCNNIVLVGQLHYGTTAYKALAAALGHTQNPETPNEAERLLKAGELQHHWLQALTRASVRNSQGNLAGACRAFVVASPGMEAAKLLHGVFPGSSVDVWQPKLKEATGQAGMLMDILTKARADDALPLPKKVITQQLGIEAPNLSRLLKRPIVRDYLDREHFWHDQYTVYSVPPIGPYEGDEYDEDGFSIDDLELSE